jgi:hypothetical protein
VTSLSAVPPRRGFRAFVVRWRWNSDNGAAILLGIAALATAWSSYQASMWGGTQASNYTRSGILRNQAVQASDSTARARLLDAALFSRWLEATVDQRPRLATIYEAHFTPALRAAFDSWRRGVSSLEATTTTPFDQPEYGSARDSQAARLQAESMRALEAGERANNTSNRYFFVTVILATVLFFAGALRPLVSAPLRNLVILIATLLCVWAIGQLLTVPVSR